MEMVDRGDTDIPVKNGTTMDMEGIPNTEVDPWQDTMIHAKHNNMDMVKISSGRMVLVDPRRGVQVQAVRLVIRSIIW